jgi:hypothetical protein
VLVFARSRNWRCESRWRYARRIHCDEHRFTDALKNLYPEDDEMLILSRFYRSYDSEENGYDDVQHVRVLRCMSSSQILPIYFPVTAVWRDEDVERVSKRDAARLSAHDDYSSTVGLGCGAYTVLPSCGRNNDRNLFDPFQRKTSTSRVPLCTMFSSRDWCEQAKQRINKSEMIV